MNTSQAMRHADISIPLPTPYGVFFVYRILQVILALGAVMNAAYFHYDSKANAFVAGTYLFSGMICILLLAGSIILQSDLVVGLSANLAGREVAEQIRRVLRGEIPIGVLAPGWTYCGNVEVHLGDWRAEFFIDCDELDYCESASTPDGRHAQFEDWYDVAQCPLDLLTDEERNAFAQMLEQAHSLPGEVSHVYG